MGFPGGLVVKNLPGKAGDAGDGFDPWVGKIHGEGNGNPLQYSCLEKSVDRGAWQANGVVKSWTRLSDEECTCLM